MEAAGSLDLSVFANSPLLQGELVGALENKADLVEAAVRFARDASGVAVALLGMKQPEHISAWKRIQFQRPKDDLSLFG